MTFHKTVKTIKDIIERAGVWHEYFEHEPVRTSEEAAKIRPEYSLAQGAKALIVRVKESGNKKYFTMFVVPGDSKFNEKSVLSLLNAKDIRFATQDEINVLTDGIEIGGIPPFGNLFDLNVYADKKIFENDKIIFNAGDKRVSIALKSSDYALLVHPQVVQIV